MKLFSRLMLIVTLAATGSAQKAYWIQTGAVSPAERVGHQMVYDSARQRVVLFGGVTSGSQTPTLYGDTWEWDGSRWTRQAVATGPSPRMSCAMAYDPVRRRTVLFGGSTGSTPSNDTWEWDGTTWQRMTSAGALPVARSNAGMVFDPVGGGVLLFGGTSPSLLGDTWTWDGTQWREHTGLAQSPTPRFDHGMATDTDRNRIVLFGGNWGLNLRDTWEWDGSRWLPGAAMPSLRPTHPVRMVYDKSRRRTVAAVASFPELWEYNGAAWSPIDSMKNVFFGYPRAMAFHDASNRSVYLNYGSPGASSNGTWELVTSGSRATTQTFGVGCGNPELKVRVDLPPIIGNLWEIKVTNAPTHVLNVYGVMGFSRTSNFGIPLPIDLAPIGAPGCSLLVRQDTVGGRAPWYPWRIHIPGDPSLAGIRVYMQFFVFSGNNPLGLTTSKGVEGVVGW